MILCFSFAAWGLYRQITGKDHRKFAEPFCGKCRADLREGWNGFMYCHQCGQMLEEPFAVYFGKKSKPNTRKKVVLRTLLIILLFYVVFGAFHLMPYMGIGVPKSVAVRKMSNARLLKTLPGNTNEWWYWIELEQRYTAGQITIKQIDQCVQQLTMEINNQTTQPINLGDNAGPFIDMLIIKKLLPKPTVLSFLEANYRQMKIKASNSTKDPSRQLLTIELTNASPLSLNSSIVPYIHLLKVTREDEPDIALAMLGIQDFGKKNASTDKPVYVDLSRLGFCQFVQPLPPGEHILKFIFDVQYYPGKVFKNIPDEDSVSTYQYTQQVRMKAIVDEQGKITLYALPVDVSQTQDAKVE